MAMPDVTVADVAPWITRLARLGYAAKAVLYTLVGVLAFGVGRASRTTGSRDALLTILGAPFGRILLGIIAAGLIGYAVWRVVEGIRDPDGRGNGFKGIALRLSFVGRGLLHGLLGISAARVALSGIPSGDDGEQAKRWTAMLLDAPGGETLVLALAGSLMAFGLYQLYREVGPNPVLLFHALPERPNIYGVEGFLAGLEVVGLHLVPQLIHEADGAGGADERGREAISDYLGTVEQRVYHVGRLDADSEGLLLLTNDGTLAHRLH